MPKQYEIKTLEDIIKAVAPTPEKMENFLKDFEAWMNIALMAKALAKSMGNEVGINSMTWIDDGKNDINITIHAKQQK